MLTINNTPVIRNDRRLSANEIGENHVYYSPMLRLGSMVLTANAYDELAPVALRCHNPMDAVELEKHGYSYSYFEQQQQIERRTLSSLKSLGICKIAFFCDANGADFDVEKSATLAKSFNILLCGVVLPFCPTDMISWDIWQWRIFHSRLARALSHSVLKPEEGLRGDCYATIH
jgi:hypothetical protein